MGCDMAAWYIIEHGDQRDARILHKHKRHADASRATKAELARRERAGWKIERVCACVWMCCRPVRGGSWDGNATVLRLITACEWAEEWAPLQEACG